MPPHFLIRLAAGTIDLLARLAPAWRQADWRDEWLAELQFRAARLEAHGRLTVPAQLRLLARCGGALFHVLFLWKHEWALDLLAQDVRYAARVLARSPGFTLTAVLTLALGIGATTAMFAAVNTVLLKPLPYPGPERLIRIHGVDTRQGQRSIGNLSVPDVVDFIRTASSVDAIGAHNYGGYWTLTGSGEPERVPRLLVTSGYFRVLGARPALGRLFGRDDDRPSPPDIVVLSYGFWMRRFGGDPSIVGRPLVLSGTPATVVGVLPPDFVHPDPSIEAAPDVFALLDPDPKVSGRGGRYVRAIARLKAGVTIDQARADLEAIAARLESEFPASNTGRTVLLRPLAEAVVGTGRTPLLLLQAATVAILLIACANLANLLLGAAAGRANELSVRTALGASRTRIVRQLLVESLVLAGAGGALGLVFAAWATASLSALAAPMLLPGQRIEIAPTVFACAAALTLATGVVFGLVPAIAVSRRSAVSLRTTRTQSDSAERMRLRSLLIGLEVALSVMLLVGAVLLIRSFSALAGVDPGFKPAHVLTFDLAVTGARYPEGQQSGFYERLYERLGSLPGVTAVGGVNILPLSSSYSCDGVQIVGRLVSEAQERCAEARSASADYFTAMGIPRIRGRVFRPSDTALAPPVVVINETMARRFFPGEDPIGRRLVYSSRGQNDSREIVGIVGDTHHFGPSVPAPPEFYVPQPQPPSYHGMTVVVRTSGDPAALVPSARAEVRALEPEAPMYNIRTLDELVATSVADARLRTLLLTLFASLAVALALVGTYGVVSLLVSHRVREMGIRLALGATRADIYRLVVGRGIRPVVAGAAAGLLAGALLARAASGLLFGVTPADPPTFVVSLLLILGAGVIASWLPARRACRIDPATALRPE